MRLPLNKECLITFVLSVIGVVIFFWLVFPAVRDMMSKKNGFEVSAEAEAEKEMESFSTEEAAAEEAPAPNVEGEANANGEEVNMIKKPPYVDAEAGVILDGPGFEKGEVSGIMQENASTIPSNYYFLDDGADGEMSIQHNLCSKSCCSEQWPTPFKMRYSPYVCNNKDKFVPSRIFCNNSFNDSGCLCLTRRKLR